MKITTNSSSGKVFEGSTVNVDNAIELGEHQMNDFGGLFGGMPTTLIFHT